MILSASVANRAMSDIKDVYLNTYGVFGATGICP